jgi:hypothetical protein
VNQFLEWRGKLLPWGRSVSQARIWKTFWFKNENMKMSSKHLIPYFK